MVLGTALGAALIVRDCSLTCNVGYQQVPFAFLAIAALAVPMVALQLRWVRRLAFERWQVACALLAALVVLGFRGWTWHVVDSNPYAKPGYEVPAVQVAYLAFYVCLDPLMVLLVANLVRLVRRVCGEEVERGIPLMAGGLLAGGLVASGVAKFAIPALMDAGLRYEIARDHLMVVTAICLFVYVGLAQRVAGRFAEEQGQPEVERWSVGSAIRLVADRPRLRWTGVLLVLTGVVAILLEYVFYWIVSDQVDAQNGRTAWFAGFYLALNGVSLAMLLLGTGKLIQRLGLVFALLSLPLALLLGGLALFVVPTVLVAASVRIARDGLTKTLFEPATECLMLRGSGDEHDVVRTVLGGLCFSLGMGLASGLLLVLTRVARVDRSMVIVTLLAAVGLWIGAVLLQARSEGVAEANTSA